MKWGRLALGALVVALALAGMAWIAQAMDGPVQPTDKAAVFEARKNSARLARRYRAGYRRYEARKHWARQMNKVCLVLGRRQRVIVGRLRRAGRLRSIVVLASKVERLSERALAAARRIHPARADRARVRRMFALYDRSMSFRRPMIEALARRDLRTFVRLGRESDRPGGQADRIATALGATACSRN